MVNKLVDAFHKYVRFVYLVYLVSLIGALIWFTLIWFIWLNAESFFQWLGIPSVLSAILKYALITLILIISFIFFNKYVKLERVFRPMIEFLELTKGPPLRLVYLVSLIGALIWFIWSNAESFFQWLGIPSVLSTSLKYALITLIFVISAIFFALVVTLMFSLERRVRVLARSYSEEDELIIFLKNEIKEWLTVILNLIKNQPSEAGRKYTDSQLEKTEYEISNKGRYLESLVTEVSSYLQVNKESVEELIGLKIGVERRIAKNIIYTYKWIQYAIEGLKNPLLQQKHRDYYQKQINERMAEIQSKKQTLNTQIKWIGQLEEKRENIRTLLRIIKEESTGKAIIILVELLKTAKTPEQLKFLIQAANARVGYKLGELLGFRLRLKPDGETELTWYNNPIKNAYLFSLNELLGKDKKIFIEFLRQNFGINRVRTVKIDKTDGGKTINVSFDNKFLTLRLNDEKTKASLTFEGGGTDELVVKTDNGKLNIYTKELYLINEFLVRFERLRDESIDELSIAFQNYKPIDYTQPISIALTFGYSAVLAEVLRNIIREAIKKGQDKDLYIKLITSDGIKTITKGEKYLPSGEKLLRDELISAYPNLIDRCNIFPIDTIKERGMEKQINQIFIGIESINRSGNVVHPRGGHNLIKQIKYENPNVKVYAFGETYKVQDFDDFRIDYTKLSMLDGNKYIDYIVTDHGVHARTDSGWKNLDCCIEHWKNKRQLAID